MAKTKAPYLAAVSWSDAHSDLDQAWIQADGFSHSALRVTTVGWVVKEDSEGVTLFSESIADSESASYRSRTFIPRGMVVTIEPLSVRKSRPRKPASETSSPASVPASAV